MFAIVAEGFEVKQVEVTVAVKFTRLNTASALVKPYLIPTVEAFRPDFFFFCLRRVNIIKNCHLSFHINPPLLLQRMQAPATLQVP